MSVPRRLIAGFAEQEYETTALHASHPPGAFNEQTNINAQNNNDKNNNADLQASNISNTQQHTNTNNPRYYNNLNFNHRHQREHPLPMLLARNGASSLTSPSSGWTTTSTSIANTVAFSISKESSMAPHTPSSTFNPLSPQHHQGDTNLATTPTANGHFPVILSGTSAIIHPSFNYGSTCNSNNSSVLGSANCSPMSSSNNSPLLSRRGVNGSSKSLHSALKMVTAMKQQQLQQQLQQQPPQNNGSMMQEDGPDQSSSALSASINDALMGLSPGSSRQLYSPKCSPGVRQNVQSPAPSQAVNSSVASYSSLPAIDKTHRYVITATLQQSLFGVVKLAFDRVLKQQVAIKISRRERAQQQQTRSGVSVLENVRREAAVMQYLYERSATGHAARYPLATRKSLYTEMFSNMTINEIINNIGNSQQMRDTNMQTLSSFTPSGSNSTNSNSSTNSSSGSVTSSNGYRKVRRMSSRALPQFSRMASDTNSMATTNIMEDEVSPNEDSDRQQRASSTPSSTTSTSSTSTTSSCGSTTPPTTPPQQGPIDATDLEGERYICGYVEELEDEHFHYLVTEFVPAGDLYSMLTSFPQHRLSESQARGLFRQMVLGVKYLHLRNVAHLDMSLENMCLDMDDAVRIIDFGVAALHPHTPTTYHTNYFSFPAASSPASNKAMEDYQPITTITSTSTTVFATTNGNGQMGPGTGICIPSPVRSFLCGSVKELSAKPGKIRYMSPELFQGLAWDAFANDVFSLGVILYSLLTGRPPFQQAESSDVWFHVIYTGQWLQPQIRKQPSAHVYTHLSEQALDLINHILKPQAQRPTCEQILLHPWMTQTD